MRRKDKEIVSVAEKLEIMDKCKVCRLGMVQDGNPYIVPMNYGYSYEDERLVLYFHGANEGRKLDVLRANNRVCFEMDCEHGLVEGPGSCNHSYTFASIIGFGAAEFLERPEEKTAALNCLMKHQTGKDAVYEFGDNHLRAVTVFKVSVTSFTGKRKAIAAT